MRHSLLMTRNNRRRNRSRGNMGQIGDATPFSSWKSQRMQSRSGEKGVASPIRHQFGNRFPLRSGTSPWPWCGITKAKLWSKPLEVPIQRGQWYRHSYPRSKDGLISFMCRCRAPPCGRRIGAKRLRWRRCLQKSSGPCADSRADRRGGRQVVRGFARGQAPSRAYGKEALARKLGAPIPELA